MIITKEKMDSVAERICRLHAEFKMSQCLYRPFDSAYCLEAIMPEIKRHPATDRAKVLEVGSGATHTYLAFYDAGADIIVTDSLDWQARRQREIDEGKTPQAGLPDIAVQQAEANAAGIKSYKLDIQNADECPESNFYDAVYSVSAIEHAERITDCIKNIFRILKPGGTFAVTTECNMTDSMKYLGDPLYIAIFLLNDFVEMLMNAGFIVHDMSPEPEHLPRMFCGKGTGDKMLWNNHFGTMGIIATKPI